MGCTAYGSLGDVGTSSRGSSCSEWLEECALESADPGLRFFWSLLGLRLSPSLPGDCFSISRNLRPEACAVVGVWETGLSVDLSLLLTGASRGTVSLRADEKSLELSPPIARGVVVSLDEAEVTSGGAGNTDRDAAVAMEVLGTELWRAEADSCSA